MHHKIQTDTSVVSFPADDHFPLEMSKHQNSKQFISECLLHRGFCPTALDGLEFAQQMRCPFSSMEILSACFMCACAGIDIDRCMEGTTMLGGVQLDQDVQPQPSYNPLSNAVSLQTAFADSGGHYVNIQQYTCYPTGASCIRLSLHRCLHKFIRRERNQKHKRLSQRECLDLMIASDQGCRQSALLFRDCMLELGRGFRV